MLPNLSGLPIGAAKRQRVDDETQDEKETELETVTVNYLSLLRVSKGVGIGGALPPLPIDNVVRKRMACPLNPDSSTALVVPTATLTPTNVYGRKTLLYHSFINPCQPEYKGQYGDRGRVKWYAFEPEMSYNFLMEAMADQKSVQAAKEAAAENTDCPLAPPDMMMDVYEVVKSVDNLMIFNDQQDQKWPQMGGQQDLFFPTPSCIPAITDEMAKSGSGVDPTVDPLSPNPELSFAKRMHEFPFEDGTRASGWIRLNITVPFKPSYYDANATGRRVLMVEMGYELMLSVENHSEYLKHVKRVKIKPSFQDPLYNVQIETG